MKLKDNFYTIENATHDADKHVFGVLLNPNHAIYAAHFPGNPITPGACTLQMVGELAEEVVGKTLQLSCAKNVKYLAPLTPTGTPCPTFALNIRCEGNTWLVKAEVKNNEHVFAKLSLVYE